MATRRLFGTDTQLASEKGDVGSGDGLREGAPLGGTRDEAMQRLQIGLTGLAGMVLLVGLASVIQNRALVTEASAVPEAASTTEPFEAAPQNDPLADAGVVPDLPAEPEPMPTQQPAIVPEKGTGEGFVEDSIVEPLDVPDDAPAP